MEQQQWRMHAAGSVQIECTEGRQGGLIGRNVTMSAPFGVLGFRRRNSQGGTSPGVRDSENRT